MGPRVSAHAAPCEGSGIEGVRKRATGIPFRGIRSYARSSAHGEQSGVILRQAPARPERARAPAQPTLPVEERERLKADVFYWGFKQARRGHPPSEEELEEEYDRRLAAAEQSRRAAAERRRGSTPAAPPAEAGRRPFLTRRNALKA